MSINIVRDKTMYFESTCVRQKVNLEIYIKIRTSEGKPSHQLLPFVRMIVIKDKWSRIFLFLRGKPFCAHF